MRTIKFIFIVLPMFSLNVYSSTIREQLKSVNPYWAYHPLAYNIMDEKCVFASDRELIQLHLQLVEKTLRTSCWPALNEEQKKHRFQLLDVLHDYLLAGVFPKNTGHPVHTPYFIDVYGTACAVGQLIISSGCGTLAKQISQENNNGYISKLVLKYPQIKDWAEEHGFAIEELAWIQPCYNPPLDTMGLRHPTCHNAPNGYFCPDFTQLQGPLIKSFYVWYDTAWVPRTNFCGQWVFNYLQAGKYKWVVKDNLNTIHTFSAELVAPPPAIVTVIKSGNFNTCNGAITVSVQGGISPFSYLWYGFPNVSPLLSQVCEQLVTLTFSEGGGMCSQYLKIQTGTVGIKEETINRLRFSPNPVTDVIQVSFDQPLNQENRVAKILNTQGQVVLEAELRPEPRVIHVNQLSPGVYFLQVDNYRVQRFVKE